MGKVLVGAEVAQRYRDDIAQEIKQLKADGKEVPHLSVILVGDNAASLSYIKGKEKACAEVGMKSSIFHLPKTITQDELIAVIQAQNQDKSVDGILVQLPLPTHISEKEVIAQLNPKKDVDGLHPMNIGNLMLNQDGFVPCTPLGVMALLRETKIDLVGKRVAVVGRSPLVGSSVAQLLTHESATVTLCHSKTENLQKICQESDVVVVAIGKAKAIGKDYIKPGAVVIDVGINRTQDGKLVGDVDFGEVAEIASFITPVPKGVGPMTIAMLLQNTLKAYKQ